MEHINHLAVFICALLSLVIGALWWSPLLFEKAWKRETGLSDEQLKQNNPLKTFGLSFVLAYIVSYNLAFFMAHSDATWQKGLATGFHAAVFPVAMYIMMGLFEQRTFRHLLINCSYMLVYFLAIGLILGIWR